MINTLIHFLLPILLNVSGIFSAQNEPNYRLFKAITVPESFLQHQDTLSYGGDIRIGDLQGKQEVDFLVYRAANSVDGGAVQPCFLGAFDLDGQILWQVGTGGEQPNRPGPVAIHDIDADGAAEIICLFTEDTNAVAPFSMQGVQLQIRNGQTGAIEKSTAPAVITSATGKGPNWVHQRILIANLSGTITPQDFIIKLGTQILAFNHHLELLWSYTNLNDQYQQCPAYIPAVGDIDQDGKDEINGGYYLLDDDGTVLWEKKLGKNMDSVAIDYWDDPERKRAFCSGYGFIMDETGDTILALGASLVPHGQELRVADFSTEYPGPEMAIRNEGHHTNVIFVAQGGQVINTFALNESPNNTGMEAVFWYGPDRPALLYNGGQLWTAAGTRHALFAELPAKPAGNIRQGWYHCIPADICGNNGEEVILYNPWEHAVYMFTSDTPGWDQPKPFIPGPRQYNVRLMD